MTNCNFDKNGLDKYGTHLFQYKAFVLTEFAIYFGWALLYDANFHYFTLKIFKFWNCNGHNSLNSFVMR